VEGAGNGRREESLRCYEHSGRVAARFWPLCVPVAILAAGAGLGYQALLDENPLILLDPLLSLAAGCFLGALGIALLHRGKVRNRAAARFGLLSILLAFHLAAVAAAVWPSLPEGGFGARFAAHFRNGDPIPGGSGGRIPGVLLSIFWGAEIFLILAGAVGLPWTWWRRAAFSEEADRFVPRERIALRYGPAPGAVFEAFRTGGVEALGRLGFRDRPVDRHEGEYRFWLHEMPDTDRDLLTVQWFGSLEGLRGRPYRREIVVVRRAWVRSSTLETLGLLPRASGARENCRSFGAG